MRTSCGPTSRRSMVAGTSGSVAEVAAKARTVVVTVLLSGGRAMVRSAHRPAGPVPVRAAGHVSRAGPGGPSRVSRVTRGRCGGRPGGRICARTRVRICAQRPSAGSVPTSRQRPLPVAASEGHRCPDQPPLPPPPRPPPRPTYAAGASTSPTSGPRPAVYRDLAQPAHGRGAGDPARPGRRRGPPRGALARPARRPGRPAAPRRRCAPGCWASWPGASARVFVLALAQRAEARSPYDDDADATAAMAADERIHERGACAAWPHAAAAALGDVPGGGLRRQRRPGQQPLARARHRAPAASPTQIVLLTGIAGLLAGALSMGAGEYVSVRSQRELLEASDPDPDADKALPAPRRRRQRARPGLPGPRDVEPPRRRRTRTRCCGAATPDCPARRSRAERGRRTRSVGTGLGRRRVQLLLLRLRRGDPGAAVPRRARGASRPWWSRRCWWASSLLATGAVVGLLSGTSPLRRGVRQLLIGFGAAVVTYLLGALFGAGSA